jgi:adenylate cyclase
VVTLYASVALATTGAVLALWSGDVLRSTDLETVDRRFAIRGEHAAPDVVVVGIDARTNSVVARFPFRRTLHARVIDRLRRAGARAIVYDVEFTAPSGDDAADDALIRAVERAPRIVLSTTEVGENGATNVFGGDDVLRAIGARAGSGNLPNDPGGVLRRVAYDDLGLRGLPIVGAELALGRPVSRDRLGADGTAWIDFPGPPRTIRTVSFGDVLRGRVPAQVLRDKVVVVGATAPVLKDVFPTSTASEDLMAGPEVQAAAIQTVLDDFPLRGAPGWLDGLLIVVLGLAGALGTARLSPARGALAGLAAAALFLVAAQLAFGAGLIVSVLYPLAALALGVAGALGVSVAVGAFERERVRDMFARFVPEAVVDDVLARVDDELRLGGERRVVTVLFSDIRGFTSYSEDRTPEEVIEVLNRYLTVMSDVILDHGGTLIAYMGDGIMATFGAPTEQVDHADRALAAAQEMAGRALAEVNDWLRARGSLDFKIGIGLNSGPVMAGNVGSERRMEYTTIGDTTNTASRLESMTKGSEHTIFLADSVRQMLTRARDDLVRVDAMRVRGKDEPVVVWSVVGRAPAPTPPQPASPPGAPR